MPGTLTVQGMSAGLASGQKVIGPVTTVGSNQVGGITTANLTAGDNYFSVPAGAIAVAIFLGTSVDVAVTVRTNLNSGDEGLAIAPTTSTPWVKLELVTGTTTIILNAAGTVQGVELSFI